MSPSAVRLPAQTLGACFLVLLLAGVINGAESDSWVGKEIITKERIVRLRIAPDGQEMSAGTLPTTIVRVEKEKGEWICIRSTNGHGWMSKHNAVLVEDAVSYFTEKIQHEPDDLRAYVARAAAYQHNHDYDRAANDLTQVLQLQPNNGAILAIRGDVWGGKGDSDKALADYADALRLDPRDGITYYNRARLWFANGEDDKALADCAEDIRIEPRSVDTYVLRGCIHMKRREYDEAITDLNEALRLAPGDARYLVNRGMALLYKEKLDSATADFTKAIVSDPCYLAAYKARAIASAAMHEYGKALDDYKKVLQRDPNDYAVVKEAVFLLAACPQAMFRDGKQALDLAKMACEKTDWDNPTLLDSYAAACAEVGAYDEAVKWQKKALEHEDYIKDGRVEAKQRLQLYQQGKPYRMEP